ncbi:MAG TPA: Lrp/AsnC family transcriptional regulator [Planctomycetota bacterium]|jgi:DNA-binding Lrp family transcriptional regulator
MDQPTIDEKSRLLLNVLQDEIPLVDQPFAALGAKIGLSEADVLARLKELKASGVVRQISAIFDTRSLGYHSSLVACKSPPGKTDEVAAIISAHPGVSHNYARRHEFDIWFTIAVPPASNLEAHTEKLRELSGALSMRLLPTLRLFKIGMKLDMTAGKAREMGIEDDAPSYNEESRSGEKQPLDAVDIACVEALQDDMELRTDFFAPAAQRVGITTAQLFERCRSFQRDGRLRRMAGIMRHRQAGFAANAMGVWNVPPERVDELGAFFARHPAVTHCYLRPRYPDWPYNVFTMVHSKDVSSCDQLLSDLSHQSGITQYGALYSYKEYKKVRLRYFTGEIEGWEKQNGLSAVSGQ